MLAALVIYGVWKCYGCSLENGIGKIVLGLIRVECAIKMIIYFRLHCCNAPQMSGSIIMRRLNYACLMETRLFINRTISDQIEIAKCDFKDLITCMILLLFPGAIS